MKEYIERAQLLKNLGYDETRRADVLPGSTFDIVLKEPAADVAEVRHGYWDDSLDGLTPYCSVCRCTHRCLIRRPIYCPNCGARMGKENEHMNHGPLDIDLGPDVVEAVRCKDCRYYQDARINKKGFLICPASGMEITETDYCSYGVHMEVED